MICAGCRNDLHITCRGGTWCDCQHRAPDKSMERFEALLGVGTPVPFNLATWSPMDRLLREGLTGSDAPDPQPES